MIDYEFGDIVLVSFPFTDQTTTKKRPAIVVSSKAYNRKRPDLIVMAVTGHMKSPTDFGERSITEWRRAGLLKPSVVKPVLATIEKRLALRKLGKLQDEDGRSLQELLQTLLG